MFIHKHKSLFSWNQFVLISFKGFFNQAYDISLNIKFRQTILGNAKTNLVKYLTELSEPYCCKVSLLEGTYNESCTSGYLVAKSNKLSCL